MEELITSFKEKVNKMGEKTKIPYSTSFIVSSDTLDESVQRQQRPSFVSIGPLYRGDANLQNMEDFKWSFLYILNFGSFSFEELSICFLGLKKLEEQSRRTYSTFVNMKSDEFVQMLLLDACFIILIYLDTLETMKIEEMLIEESSLSTAVRNLLSVNKISEILRNFKLSNFSILAGDVSRDLYIVDNQIPFFILEYMWKWILESLHVPSPLQFLECLRIIFRSEPIFPEEILHFLHFFHCSSIPQPTTALHLYDRYYRPEIPSVTELRETGVDFVLEDVPGDDLPYNITFTDGVLHIPQSNLSDDLRKLLQNVVNFEQSVRGDHSTSISNYVWIMSCLLSKEDDVKILRLQNSFQKEKGWNKDFQRFFHSLERRCSYWKVDDEMNEMVREINRYRFSRRNRWKGIFQSKFCNNPWVTLSVTGAIILFILTFLQTFFAMYAYFRPPS